MRRPKVCYIVEPGVDGVFRHVAGLIGHMRHFPVEVAGLVYSDRRGSPELATLVEGLRQNGVPTLNLRVSNQPTPRDLPALARLHHFLARLASSAKGDIICHAHSSKAGALLRLLPFVGARMPIIYSPHGYYGVGGGGGLKTAIFDTVEQALGGEGVTVCVSESERTYATGRLGIRRGAVVVIHNGVDLTQFRPPASAEEKKETRRRFGIPEDAVVIGTVGRYGTQKDPWTFYAAVDRLWTMGRRVWILHCGGGPGFDEFGHYLAGKPYLNQLVRIRHLSDTSDVYRAMDLFILCSRYEGFALSAQEAMGSGLPMVLTCCTGNVDLASWGLDGIEWCRPGDAADVARAIDRSLLRLDRGANNHREIAESRGGKVGEAAKYAQLYAAVSSNAAGDVR